MRQLISAARCPVWINDGVISAAEIKSLRDTGIDLTVFSSTIDPRDYAEIEKVVSIVAMHHPDDRVWVEMSCDSAD